MDKNQLGFVHVYWGNGKGKTSAALGTALRACGHGYKVHLVQFLKNSSDKETNFSGELYALKKLENFSFKCFGAGEWILGKPSEKDIQEAESALAYLKSSFKEDYSLIIADEILYSIQLGVLKEEEVISLIKEKPKHLELILTGSRIPFPNIFNLSHYVTELKKGKHPYDLRILARKGIDY